MRDFTPIRNKERNHLILTLISLFLLFIYFCCLFVIDNLHQDGLVYSSISRNMSIGLGSTWHPAYSESQFQTFYEHPALGLWLGSLFFQVFGDHSYTEKIFSSIVAFLNLYYLVFFWKQYAKQRVSYSKCWVVIFSWFLIPLFVFYYSSNLLEMLANTFALPTIHLLIKTIECKQTSVKIITYHILIAALLVLAFLINGPLTLFPLAFYGCHFIVYRKLKVITYLRYSVQLLISFSLILLIFCFLNEGLYQNLKLYLSSQLFALFNGTRTDASVYGLNKLLIIRLSLNQFVYMLVVTAIGIYLYGKKINKEGIVSVFSQIFYNRELQLFFLIGLTALLPITLSAKQFSHYALQACFFFQLCFLLFNTEVWLKLADRLALRSIYLLLICVVFLTGAFIYFGQSGLSRYINAIYIKLYESIDRQHVMKTFSDSQKVGKYLAGKSKTIAVHKMDYARTPRVINTYLVRRYRMSITKPEDSQYYLVDKRRLWLPPYQAQLNDTLSAHKGAKLLMDLNLYKLYKLR